MACSYPMWRIDWKKHLQGDKSKRRRHRLCAAYEKRVHNGGVIINRPEFEMLQSEYPHLAKQVQQIPCGKCIQCRLSYSRDWANRAMCELKTAKNAFFLTLTYDDAHLHFAPYVDAATGEVSTRPVLDFKDMTKFLKRLRKVCSKYGYKEKLRYIYCGEYGEDTKRPHFHMILYNVPPQLLHGDPLWTSPERQPRLWYANKITEIWKHGLVVYGDVEWHCCAYVARYIVGKQLGKSRKEQIKAQELFFPGIPWQDEQIRTSRRPGIGRDFYEQNKYTIYESDELNVNIKDKLQAVRPAKYYDRLYDVEYPEALQRLKRIRSEQAERSMRATLATTDLSEEEYLQLKERSKIKAVERLPRPDM